MVPKAVQDAQRQPLRKAVQLPLHAPQRLLGLPVPAAPVDHVTQLEREPESDSDSSSSSKSRGGSSSL